MSLCIKNKLWLLSLLFFVFPSAVLAEDVLNTGDTSWLLTSTALVLFMTIPGLSLFYAGLVRSKNVLSVLMQCFTITCLASLIWLVFGYSLAFSDGGSMNSWLGGFSNTFLSEVTRGSMIGTIPETVFVMFQMTFAIITPALIVGAFAERMKFSTMLVFMAAWVTICYVPMVHMVSAASEEAVTTGMRVVARWADEPRGHITDIACFEPA